MATLAGTVQAPPFRPIYGFAGLIARAKAQSRPLPQNSELASSRSSDSRRSVNGGVTGETRAHRGNLPSVQTRAKARAPAFVA